MMLCVYLRTESTESYMASVPLKKSGRDILGLLGWHRYDHFHHWTSSSKGTNKSWKKGGEDIASVSLFKLRAETMKRSILGEKLKELWDGRGRVEKRKRGSLGSYRLVTKLGLVFTAVVWLVCSFWVTKYTDSLSQKLRQHMISCSFSITGKN